MIHIGFDPLAVRLDDSPPRYLPELPSAYRPCSVRVPRGWRKLAPEEVIRAGDRVFNMFDRAWCKVQARHRGHSANGYYCVIRRVRRRP